MNGERNREWLEELSYERNASSHFKKDVKRDFCKLKRDRDSMYERW
jgi:hypothetical protein